MNPQWFTEVVIMVREYAPKMKSGLDDILALEKLYAEQKELQEDLDVNDLVGALTELADVCYYAAKAYINNLITAELAVSYSTTASTLCEVTPQRIPDIIRAKYDLRSKGIKDDIAERRAVVRSVMG